MDQKLLAFVMWLFIDHEASTLHHDGVTAVKIAEHICTITTAFILMTLKILVFIENYLLKKEREKTVHMHAQFTGKPV